ncbi:UNVERIFIED_CONTAM: hypothetical protein Sradi_2637100 [Sesamum radiatum]|uniref:MULE transposase domain-containing protein n=1 Tax=Sesamum radiatum TaxID=300843 RepID=A0AAW2S4Z5_SESRA
MQLYRAKKKALEQIDGSYGDSYSKLPHYAEMVRRSNHGSIVKLQYNHGENDDEGDLISSILIVPSFKRIFVGLDALKKGFLQGCSPFLGFDGCHLKGLYGGVLLAAIGLDGNNGLFPLAFAVVESECKDSWCFFFQALDEMLGGFAVDRPWTFMSDRQKGLLECINDMVPHAINRRIWDVSGIPCRHACLAISHQRDNIEVYIDISFSKEKYMMTYTHVIHPIPDVKFWKNLDDVQPSTILPPPLRRLPGRPRKSRRKETGEQSNVKPGIAMRCTICHEIGHNKRTCQRTTVGASQRNKSKKNIRRNKRNAQILRLMCPVTSVGEYE